MTMVKFEVNPEKEYEYHQLFRENSGLNGASIFSFTPIGDKQRIVKKIENFWDEDDRKIIKKIEEKWRVIEKDYFKMIKDVTGTKWLFDAYHAYFLAFSTMIGFSNPLNLGSDEIALTTGSIVNPKFLVGHELFHCHYYYIVNKMKLTGRLNRTVFTEGTAALALFETDAFSSINSYVEVSAKWSVFLEHWRRRVSFEDFLLKIAGDSRL